MMSDSKWIFITGIPRTGTTLAQRILNIHRSCDILSETFFPLRFMDMMKIPSDTNWDNSILTSCNLPTMQSQDHVNVTACRFARSLSETLRGLFGSPRFFGDKAPSVYCDRWGELTMIFPDAKFIIMERDGDEVFESIRDCGWFPNMSDDDLAGYIDGLERSLSPLKNLRCSLVVPLEDLNKWTNEWVKTMLSHLEMDDSRNLFNMEDALFLVEHGNINFRPSKRTGGVR